MNRRFALIQALVSLVALAAVVWWAAKQEAPEFPSGGGVVRVAGRRRWRSTRSPRSCAASAGTGSSAATGVRTPRGDCYALTTVGYMGNNVLPARAGEALKVVLLSTALRREQAHGARVGRRRANPRPGRAGRDLRRGRLRRAQLERAPDRPAAARSPALGVLLLVARRDRALGDARPPRVRARARLAAAARRRAARAARAARARCCSPARSCSGRSRQPCTWPWRARSSWTSASPARSTWSRSPTSSRRFPPPRGRSARSTPPWPSAPAGSGRAARWRVTYMLLLRFVLYIPITVVGLVILVTRYGGWSRLRSAVRLERARGRPRPPGGHPAV